MIGFISATNTFLLLTPITIVWLIWSQQRAVRKTAKSAESAAEKVAHTLLKKSNEDKKDLDEKLEVIRKDVNSNLTAALKEIDQLTARVEYLKERLGITEENPEDGTEA